VNLQHVLKIRFFQRVPDSRGGEEGSKKRERKHNKKLQMSSKEDGYVPKQLTKLRNYVGENPMAPRKVPIWTAPKGQIRQGMPSAITRVFFCAKLNTIQFQNDYVTVWQKKKPLKLRRAFLAGFGPLVRSKSGSFRAPLRCFPANFIILLAAMGDIRPPWCSFVIFSSAFSILPRRPPTFHFC